jgi:hypothetical protein
MNRLLRTLSLLVLMMSVQVKGMAQDQVPAKFEPPAGRQLLIIGQDLGAIGGFHSRDNDGYSDHFKRKPGGVTTYTDLTDMEGLSDLVGYGSGDTCARCILNNHLYDHSVLAIGLDIEGQLKQIAAGKQNDQIYALGKWIRRTNRPIFLRVGYEFDGSWNHYDPSAYKKVFRKIVTTFRKMHVNNCATVWQAAASPFNANNNKNINDWYPGDNYVDWVGYSWFQSTPKKLELTDKVLAFARAHQKPVMVCESASQGYDTAKLTFRDVSNGKNPKSKTPEEIWNEWYVPYFDYIEKNKDVIKVVAYIDVDWDIQKMWGPPYKMGYWGDSRVEANPFIKAKWIETISQDKWMLSSPTLFSDLGFASQ